MNKLKHFEKEKLNSAIKKFICMFNNPREIKLFENFVKCQALIKDKYLSLINQDISNETNKEEQFVFIQYVLFDNPTKTDNLYKTPLNFEEYIETRFNTDDEKNNETNIFDEDFYQNKIYKKIKSFKPNSKLLELFLNNNPNTHKDKKEFENSILQRENNNILIYINNLKERNLDLEYFFRIYKEKILLKLKKKEYNYDYFSFILENNEINLNKTYLNEEFSKSLLKFIIELSSYSEFNEELITKTFETEINYQFSIKKNQDYRLNFKTKYFRDISNEVISLINSIIKKSIYNRSFNESILKQKKYLIMCYLYSYISLFNIEDLILIFDKLNFNYIRENSNVQMVDIQIKNICKVLLLNYIFYKYILISDLKINNSKLKDFIYIDKKEIRENIKQLQSEILNPNKKSEVIMNSNYYILNSFYIMLFLKEKEKTNNLDFLEIIKETIRLPEINLFEQFISEDEVQFIIENLFSETNEEKFIKNWNKIKSNIKNKIKNLTETQKKWKEIYLSSNKLEISKYTIEKIYLSILGNDFQERYKKEKELYDKFKKYNITDYEEYFYQLEYLLWIKNNDSITFFKMLCNEELNEKVPILNLQNKEKIINFFSS